jgi:uncharacterized protein (UPF0335 family)
MSECTLRGLVEALEAIDAQIAALRERAREIRAEAKAAGFCPVTIRRLIARRALAPEQRAAADALLAAYEAELEVAPGPQQRGAPGEAARELAIAILAEQIEGMADPARAAQLAEHVAVILDVRAEIAELRACEKSRKALAVGEGFDGAALTRVVRWIEQVARRGGEAMRADEALFHLYRGTIEARGGPALPAPQRFDPAAERKARSAAAARKAARTAAWLASGLGD